MGVGEWSVDARTAFSRSCCTWTPRGDTHNDIRGVAGIRYRYALADGLACGIKAGAAEGLVHDGGANAAAVSVFKFPPRKIGNSERGEISGRPCIHA